MAGFVLSVVGEEPLPLKHATSHVKKVLLLMALDALIIMMWLTLPENLSIVSLMLPAS